MQYSRIVDRVINSRLVIDKPICIHIIPDFETTVSDVLSTLNINTTNLFKRVISTKTLRMGASMVTPKDYYNQALDADSNIVNIIPNKIPTNKFIIIDQTSLSKVLFQLSENYNGKILAARLAEVLKSSFRDIKANYKYEQFFIFTINNEAGMYDLLANFKHLDNSDLMFIDKYAAIAVGDSIIPILSIDDKGKVDFNLALLSKAKTLIPDKVEEPESISVEPTKPSPTIPEDKPKNISAEIQSDNIVRALDGVSVTHPVINDNIQNTIDAATEKTHDELANKVFKTIHKTLHGTEKLTPSVKHDPKLLMKQLVETTTYTKTIEDYPEPSHNIYALAPNDMVKLKSFTGPVRHEFEFNDSIHKNIHHLFSSLEQDPTNPVKIVDFKYEYADDDLNRFIEYTITVKNSAGGRPHNYDIKLKIPALVNGRYFKLNGNNYIISNQQFLVPITKDSQNEARFITHYNMARLSTVNLKFNVHQIKEILSYIQIKYPIIIKSFEKNSKGEVFRMQFNDELETEVDITSSTIFKNLTHKLAFVDGNYVLQDAKNNIINEKVSRNEYIYDKIVEILVSVDPTEKLKRTRKSISFIRLHIMGRKIPLIMFMWQQVGLINTLVKYNIDYEIGETPKTNPFFTLQLDNKKKLFLYPDNSREELIVNGLFVVIKLLEELTEKDLYDSAKIELILDNKYGTKTSAMFNLATKTFIDPTTKSLLEYENLPTNLVGIIDGPLMNKLLNEEPDDPAALKNLRVRQSEVVAHLLYQEMAMAMNKYKQDLSYGLEDAHVFMQKDYIINNLLGKHAHSGESGGGGMLSFTNPFSPIDEIVTSSRVIKTGVGGIPNLRAFKAAARDLGPEHANAISAHGTSEYAGVGAINTHSLGATISDKHGTYLHKDINNAFDHVDSMGLSEVLVPFASTMDFIWSI